MKTSDVLVLGGLAYLVLRKPSQPYVYDVPETEAQRWTRYTPEPIEKSIYQYAYAAASIPIAALVPMAQFVKNIWDIPTTESFGVYGVDKGTYSEYYYTL